MSLKIQEFQSMFLKDIVKQAKISVVDIKATIL